MIYYLILILSTILYSGTSAYYSYKLNQDSQYFIHCYLIALIPIWTIISKFSKNILFDAIVFDLTLMITFSIVLIILTKKNLDWINYIGLALIFVGLGLFKKG